jgi:hypothetical protein
MTNALARLNFNARGGIDRRVMRLAGRNGHGTLVLCAMTTAQLEATATAYASVTTTTDDLLRRWRSAIAKEAATMYEKAINYDPETRDFAMHLDGELVGFARSYQEAEVTLDQLIHELLTERAVAQVVKPRKARKGEK